MTIEDWPSIANTSPPTEPLQLPFRCKACGDLIVVAEKDLKELAHAVGYCKNKKCLAKEKEEEKGDM